MKSGHFPANELQAFHYTAEDSHKTHSRLPYGDYNNEWDWI